MGVSGAGKSTVGKLLADGLGWSFYEGDDFHPRSNVVKMAQGIPLTDDDRWPWLRRIRLLIDDLISSGRNGVITSSALKQTYRDELVGSEDDVKLVYLKGEYGLILSRLEERQDHFMEVGLLESQFQTMEEPVGAVTLDVTSNPEVIVAGVKSALGL
jgi:gluconokinase